MLHATCFPICSQCARRLHRNPRQLSHQLVSQRRLSTSFVDSSPRLGSALPPALAPLIFCPLLPSFPGSRASLCHLRSGSHPLRLSCLCALCFRASLLVLPLLPLFFPFPAYLLCFLSLRHVCLGTYFPLTRPERLPVFPCRLLSVCPLSLLSLSCFVSVFVSQVK